MLGVCSGSFGRPKRKCLVLVHDLQAEQSINSRMRLAQNSRAESNICVRLVFAQDPGAPWTELNINLFIGLAHDSWDEQRKQLARGARSGSFRRTKHKKPLGAF